MKKILLIILFTSPCLAEGPQFRHRDPITNREFQSVYQDLRNVRVSSSTLPSGSTQYIQNSSTLQSGAVFNVSSGTVGQLNVSSTTQSDSQFRMRGIDGGTFAVLVYSKSVQQLAFGSDFTNGANIARSTTSFIVATTADSLVFRANGGLTPGNSFVPTLGWRMTENGEITQDLQPSFLVTDGAGATDVTGNGTTYTVTWPTEVFDQGGDFVVSGASSGTFTAPVTGRYQFNYSIRLASMTTVHDVRIVRIVTSNRTFSSTYQYSLGEGTTGHTVTISVLTDMDANDTATTNVYCDGSTKTVDIPASALTNHFSGGLVN